MNYHVGIESQGIKQMTQITYTKSGFSATLNGQTMSAKDITSIVDILYKRKDTVKPGTIIYDNSGAAGVYLGRSMRARFGRGRRHGGGLADLESNYETKFTLHRLCFMRRYGHQETAKGGIHDVDNF